MNSLSHFVYVLVVRFLYLFKLLLKMPNMLTKMIDQMMYGFMEQDTSQPHSRHPPPAPSAV